MVVHGLAKAEMRVQFSLLTPLREGVGPQVSLIILSTSVRFRSLKPTLRRGTIASEVSYTFRLGFDSQLRNQYVVHSVAIARQFVALLVWVWPPMFHPECRIDVTVAFLPSKQMVRVQVPYATPISWCLSMVGNASDKRVMVVRFYSSRPRNIAQLVRAGFL